MTSKRQSLIQKRAAAAWIDVEQVQSDKIQKKYGTLARKLPTMIQMNGLGTVLAFLLAKGKDDDDDAHTMIFNHVSKWVLSQVKDPTRQYDHLMALVRDVEMDVYRRATAEAVEYGIWIKRYVEAKDWGDAEGDSE